jgi:hypothetical protein
MKNTVFSVALVSLLGAMVPLSMIYVLSREPVVTAEAAPSVPPATVLPEPTALPVVATVKPIQINKAIFEPVYRTSKAIEGAVGSGVTRDEYRELLQACATEIGIAKDHDLTPNDTALLAKYDEALHMYQFAGTIWTSHIDYLQYSNLNKTELQTLETTYHIKINIATSAKGAMQVLWKQAGEILADTTATYYGRTK